LTDDTSSNKRSSSDRPVSARKTKAGSTKKRRKNSNDMYTVARKRFSSYNSGKEKNRSIKKIAPDADDPVFVTRITSHIIHNLINNNNKENINKRGINTIIIIIIIIKNRVRE
jgi:thiamine kinase-like enzyme